jgi:hypothetical protein
MKRNIGTYDRLLRLIIAVIITGLYVTNIISGTFGLVLLVIATAFTLTSFIGFCPLYFTLRISTHKTSFNQS